MHGKGRVDTLHKDGAPLCGRMARCRYTQRGMMNEWKTDDVKTDSQVIETEKVKYAE